MASVKSYLKPFRPILIMIFLLLVGFLTYITATDEPDDSVNDFAEFETEGDEDEEEDTEPQGANDQDDEDEGDIQEEADESEATIEEADEEQEEFDHFTDEEEFEGYSKEKIPKGKSSPQPDLKIEKVPVHLRANWEGFYAEILTLAGLAVYALNFFAGRSKNSRLASSWMKSNKELLESNFSIVGDDGSTDEPQQGVLVKESESLYSLWCTGRVGCDGMLVEIKLQKRHDLVSVMSYLLRPAKDTVTVTVHMTEEEMDNFVFAVLPKKTATKMQKELPDLTFFCPDKRSGVKYDLPASYVILSESHEAACAILSQQITRAISGNEEIFDSLIFSDQYIGPKQPDDDEQAGNGKPIKPKKVLIFNFIVPSKGTSTKSADMVKLEPMMKLVIQCIDRVRRFKLGKEAKAKAEKNRRELEENLLKQSHAQRQEAAQQRREDKIRAEKERIMQEDDPDRQRRLEEKEHKKEMKKRNPFKVKQVKARG
ncbi:PAT complex subunit CCDC47-like [Montipora foliosa]|uniref:PAT complex subunit CCDC47-like n=1 Tax=Montipora foliosa TaxID=591990 RepID=UPI0035F118E5